MNFTFVNNWLTTLIDALPPAASSLPVSPAAIAALADGRYRLTITSTLDPFQQAASYEIVELEKAGASITLSRGMEGTGVKSWPAESYVFAALTSGIMHSIGQRIGALEQQLATLEQRIEDCCNSQQPVTGGLADHNGNQLIDGNGNNLTPAGASDTASGVLQDENGNQLTDHNSNTLGA